MAMAVDLTHETMATVPAVRPDTAKVRRGVNLGCGTVALPCERPNHHNSIPEELYTDAALEWHNVDRNTAPGVTHTLDLFQYPWALASNAYDVAICAHIVEHIPHHITWNGQPWGDLKLETFSPYAQELIKMFGQVVPHHPRYQDGWFAWFSELWRILKPGGKAYILVPFAWSHGGISDPTHTRYITWATLNYFNVKDDSPFCYAMQQRWKVDIEGAIVSPHEANMEAMDRKMALIQAVADIVTYGKAQPEFPIELKRAMTMYAGNTSINAIAELMFEIEALK